MIEHSFRNILISAIFVWFLMKTTNRNNNLLDCSFFWSMNCFQFIISDLWSIAFDLINQTALFFELIARGQIFFLRIIIIRERWKRILSPIQCDRNRNFVVGESQNLQQFWSFGLVMFVECTKPIWNLSVFRLSQFWKA